MTPTHMSPKILIGAVIAGIIILIGIYIAVAPSLRSDVVSVQDEVQPDTSDDESMEREEEIEEVEREEVPSVEELQDARAEEGESVATPQPSAAATQAPAGFTKEEVAKHSDEASCWTIVNGSVYDVTSFIGKHPGGEKNILRLCGKDGTSAFEGKHGGESRPESTLEGYRIGGLVE